MAGKYTAHWCTIGYKNSVHIMLARSTVGTFGRYILQAYSLEGDLVGTKTSTLNIFQTETVILNDLISDPDEIREGFVIVSDSENKDDEFFAVLRLETFDGNTLNTRYVPFTRSIREI